MATLVKREFSLAKSEVQHLVPEFVDALGQELNDGLVQQYSILCEDAKKCLERFENGVKALAEALVDEDRFNEVYKKEDEDTYFVLKSYVVKLKGKLAVYHQEKEREREEREREKEREREEREREKEREERERERERKYDLEKQRMENENALELKRIESYKEVELKEIEVRKEVEISNRSSTVSSSQNSSYLPKLTIEKFNGKVSMFQEFWDSFSFSVDGRTDIPNSVKFTYLKSLLSGKALDLIQGIRITDDNYELGVKTLKEHYDVPEVIISQLYREVTNLKPLSYRNPDVLSYFSQVESRLKLLENHNCNFDTDGILKCHLFANLPIKLQHKLVEEKGATFTLQNIRQVMSNEIKVSQLVSSLTHKDEASSTRNLTLRDQNSQKKETRPFHTSAALLSGNDDKDKGTFHSVKFSCLLCCKESHRTHECDVYKDCDSRRTRLSDRCFLCLGRSHNAKSCKKKRFIKCDYCNVKSHHHRVLCPKQFPSQRAPESPNLCSIASDGETSNENSLTETNLCNYGSLKKRVYLQTVSAYVYRKGFTLGIEVRIVLDCGATSSYISQRLFEKLGLKKQYTKYINVFTFGKSNSETMKVHGTEVEVRDRSGKIYTLGVNVVPTIVGSKQCDSGNDTILREIHSRYPLADRFYTSGADEGFDLLIGNDYYSIFMLDQRVRISDDLFLVNSVFGYVLSGRLVFNCQGDADQQNLTSLVTSTDESLNSFQDIRNFWDLEVIGIRDDPKISEDDLALTKFRKTIRQEKDRYYVSFPWKDELMKNEIQTNFGLAFGRLGSLIKRHKSDGILEICQNTFEEQLKNGILQSADLNTSVCHYFPYHAIIRLDRVTTKVRFVMDASAKQNRSKPGLNDLLYRGPVLLENLCGMLVRFRLYKYGVISDIEKAFLNVGLNNEDRDYTRILWVKDINAPLSMDNIVAYRHTRIPFGVSSSPFLLAGVLDTHFSKYEDNRFINVLKRNIYVDNLITSLNDENDVVDFITESRGILSDASFNLREWSTNYNGLDYDQIPQGVKSENIVHSVLGLEWDSHSDVLRLKNNFKLPNSNKITKRIALSLCSSVYDPLGFWGPAIVALKLLIQKAWENDKEWDIEFDEVDSKLFFSLLQDIKLISSYYVPRTVGYITKDTQFQIHAFSDACATAYSTAVYLRCCTGSIVTSNLVFSKVRISPKNKPTLPRLELLGALIAFRSLCFINKQLGLDIKECFLWSDNQCVLHWISSTKVLPTFVKNRVKEIRSSEFPINFKYVPTEQNPADILCRGLPAQMLNKNSLWWYGPDWLLKSREEWPNIELQKTDLLENELDLMETNLVVASKEPVYKPVNLNECKYNSFKKLVNITCYIRKFINIKFHNLGQGPITLEEYETSRKDWLKYLQYKHFAETIKVLQDGQRDSLSINLGLELSQTGLLVCKGRFLELEGINYESFPILLPKKDYLTRIIVQDAHEKCFHLGTNQTLAYLRNEFWLPCGRAEVKNILKICVSCKKFKVGPYATPEFSVYPNYRLNKNLAFTFSAMDYFGPLYVKCGREVRPVWCLLFTCLTVRAVHFEVVETQSTSDLMLAFRRFVARRGGCRTILVDNAPQFHLLKKAIDLIFSQGEFRGLLNTNKIEFQFTPALSPWAGGCFERLISLTKQCLRKSIGKLRLTGKQLETLMTEIEFIINSRPLGYYGEEDLIITPNHFLGIKRDVFSPDVNKFEDNKDKSNLKNLIREWKKGNSYLDIFWSKWNSQYINFLRERKNSPFKQGKVSKCEPLVGDVVLVRQLKKVRASWPFGRVEKLHFGRDKKVRSVDVRLPSGITVTRPVSWLYPFECDLQYSSDS